LLQKQIIIQNFFLQKDVKYCQQTDLGCEYIEVADKASCELANPDKDPHMV
jgi:hypothetical protein